MNDQKMVIVSGNLIIEKREGEMIVFIADDANLSYTIETLSEEYNINLMYNSRSVDPVVMFVARRTGNIVSLSKIALTDTDEFIVEPAPFDVEQYQFHKNNNEKFIYNGSYYTARIIE